VCLGAGIIKRALVCSWQSFADVQRTTNTKVYLLVDFGMTPMISHRGAKTRRGETEFFDRRPGLSRGTCWHAWFPSLGGVFAGPLPSKLADSLSKTLFN